MKLIAIDLDGTLLSDDGTISKENATAIHDVQGMGDIVAISSGRSLHDTQHILNQAKITCPIITGNGAVIYYSHNVLRQFTIPLEILSTIMNTVEKHQLYYEIYTNKGVLIKDSGKKLLNKEIQQFKQHSAQNNAYRKVDIQYNQYGLVHVLDYHSIDLSTLDPYKVFVMSFNYEALDKLRSELAEMTDIALTTSGKEKLEIAHKHASKGNSLNFIADYFNVSMENTVAIGDNLNDISMFEAAGKGIAMENAEQDLKEHANFITKHHNHNGVAHALKEYL